MVAKDRYSWDLFARRSTEAGYVALAVDLPYSYQSPRPDELDRALQTLRAARDVLVERGADAKDIVVVGASLGANLAAQFLVDDPSLFGAVLVSPGLEYRGVVCDGEVLHKAGRRPVLVVVAKGDSYSATTARKLGDDAAGLFELREYEGSAHGTDLLDRTEHVGEQVMIWLGQMLGSGARAEGRDAAASGSGVAIDDNS